MDRVDYHLERLLPWAQLVSSLGLFRDDELRAITLGRKKNETQFITRGVTLQRFARALQEEEGIANQVLDRVTELKKRDSDAVSPRDVAQLKRMADKYAVSIVQRLTQKLGRSDAAVFAFALRYLQFRKMRKLYSEVAAQALALHPHCVDLWIEVAHWELNGNLDASAARTVLLRGIRLNTPLVAPQQANNGEAGPSSLLKRAAETAHDGGKQGRRKKAKAKKALGSTAAVEVTELEQEAEAEAETPEATESSFTPYPLTLPGRLDPRDSDLLLLWAAYFRMELVFLERLRRRWQVLGIKGDQAEKGGQSKDSSGSGSEEEDSEAADYPSQASPPTSILSGSLALIVFQAALSLPPYSSSSSGSSKSPALPYDVRFMFLEEARTLVLNFPFKNGNSDNKDGEECRQGLLNSMREACEPLKVIPANGDLLVLAKQAEELEMLLLGDTRDDEEDDDDGEGQEADDGDSDQPTRSPFSPLPSTTLYDPTERNRTLKHASDLCIESSRKTAGQSIEALTSLDPDKPRRSTKPQSPWGDYLDSTLCSTLTDYLPSEISTVILPHLSIFESLSSSPSPKAQHFHLVSRCTSYLLHSLLTTVHSYSTDLDLSLNPTIDRRTPLAQWVKLTLQRLPRRGLTRGKVAILIWLCLAFPNANDDDEGKRGMEGPDGAEEINGKKKGKGKGKGNAKAIQDPLLPFLEAVIAQAAIVIIEGKGGGGGGAVSDDNYHDDGGGREKEEMRAWLQAWRQSKRIWHRLL